MSNEAGSHTHYNELISICQNHIDTFNSLYKLNTKDDKELETIYKNIKTNLIDLYKYPPNKIIQDISCITLYNNRYTKSYLTLAKQLFDEYHYSEIKFVEDTFNYLFYKEYGIILDKDEKEKFNEYESENYSSDIHSENTIYKAIMDDDKISFIGFVEMDGFDKDQKLKSDLYPSDENGLSFLELCCYYGSVDCFKFLITKLNPEITPKCLVFSFLGGNQDIISECLKVQIPDEICMEFAITSHNIDFVSFLMNEHNIEINLKYCVDSSNLHAFLIYLDQTNDVDSCLANSPAFCLPSLCEYLIKHGANVNAKYANKTALHYAVIFSNKEVIELLISHGANVNAKDHKKYTPLHNAVICNNKEITELLISHGANANKYCAW